MIICLSRSFDSTAVLCLGLHGFCNILNSFWIWNNANLGMRSLTILLFLPTLVFCGFPYGHISRRASNAVTYHPATLGQPEPLAMSGVCSRCDTTSKCRRGVHGSDCVHCCSCKQTARLPTVFRTPRGVEKDAHCQVTYGSQSSACNHHSWILALCRSHCEATKARFYRDRYSAVQLITLRYFGGTNSLWKCI
jgi:hypothetical protein